MEVLLIGATALCVGLGLLHSLLSRAHTNEPVSVYTYDFLFHHTSNYIEKAV